MQSMEQKQSIDVTIHENKDESEELTIETGGRPNTGGRPKGEGEIEPTRWESCCFSVDKEVVQYSVKTLFSGVILTFSLYKISVINSSCHPLISFWTGLVGMIAGSLVEQGTTKLGGGKKL